MEPASTLNRDTLLLVLAQTDKTIQLGSQLSKNIALRNEAAYIKTLCQNPISFSEVRRFYSTAPTSFVIFEYISRRDKFGLYPRRYPDGTKDLGTTGNFNREGVTTLLLNREGILFEGYHRSEPVSSNISYKVSSLGYVAVSGDPELNSFYHDNFPNASKNSIVKLVTLTLGESGTYPPQKPPESFVGELDFTSQYQIYRSRLGCVRRIPNYARDKILQQLDTLTINARKGITELLFTYGRLYCELTVINHDFMLIVEHFNNEIFYNTSTDPNIVDDRYYKIILEQVDRWILVLKKYYSKLE